MAAAAAAVDAGWLGRMGRWSSLEAPQAISDLAIPLYIVAVGYSSAWLLI